MPVFLPLIAAATCAATLLGGLTALRFRDQLHLILGFSAGAVIGVAFFDLLPEAIRLGSSHFPLASVTSVVALAFLIYLVLDRAFIIHAHADEAGHGHRATLGAGTLSLHSLLDGLAIGFAFQVAPAVGVIVAAAVLAHDFSDGINTINLVLKNGGSSRLAFRWLIIDALAPLVGIGLTLFISVSASTLGLILAAFCGFFIYIGASDLLPESHHRHPTLWTSFATALGIATLYIAVTFANL